MRRAIIAAAMCLVACQQEPHSPIYTLYRSSVTGPMRIHVATFDSDAPEEYNRENCNSAMELFQAQPGVRVRYWCEMGRYRA